MSRKMSAGNQISLQKIITENGVDFMQQGFRVAGQE